MLHEKYKNIFLWVLIYSKSGIVLNVHVRTTSIEIY